MGDLSVWDILAVVAFGFWIGLALDRRRWWPSRWRLPPLTPGEPSTDDRRRGEDGARARVTVVVPARNEALVLGQSLPALLAQERSFDRVVVVDDHSTDGTARAAREVAASRGSKKLCVVEGRPSPPEWTGKLNALQTGIDLVEREECSGRDERSGEDRRRTVGATEAPSGGERAGWFLFTDADILHPEDSIERLLAHAIRGPYDLVSVMVRLSTTSPWERFLIPPFVYFFQLMYPFRRVSDPHSRVAAAAGGCVLMRRGLLEKIGGLVSMRDAIIDDVTLARRVKEAGGRCWLGSEDNMVSLRGYTTLREIVDMVARTAFTELRYRYLLVVLTWVVLAIFFVSPPLVLVAALCSGRLATAGLALITWGIQTASLAPVVRHLRAPVLWSTLLPFASAVYGAITGISAWRCFRGRGIVWRGRTHEGGPTAGRRRPQGTRGT